ncbi:flagellar hook-length control protein FliK [Aquipuribacter sp. SD81]|uniref:flagellar hook-length control protein FliK n=1 Tax=Aquipuribacter sp. SD81 TaxID=3127703 RepID=UPI0030192868
MPGLPIALVPASAAAPVPVAPGHTGASPDLGPFTLEQLDRAAAVTRARLATSAVGDVTRLVVHLSPAELGPVRVTAELTPAGLQVSLAGGDEATRDALRQSLGDLRDSLGDGRGHGRGEAWREGWGAPGGRPDGSAGHPGRRDLPGPGPTEQARRPVVVADPRGVEAPRTSRGVDVRA